MIEVETVRELLKEITPGEWLTENRPGQNGFVYALNDDGVNRMSAGIAAGKVGGGERAPEAETHANARLIAAAPDIAALALAQAAEITRLREALTAAERHGELAGRLAHPWYGPCDVMAEDGGCAECQRVRDIPEPPAMCHARHGGKYKIHAYARIPHKGDGELQPGAAVVIYESPDGLIWACSKAEFDQQFTEIA